MSKERKKKESKMVPIIKSRVTDELRKQNISQAKMCDKIGISREYFSRRLKAGQISEYFLSLVADFLGCSVEWLSDPSVPIKTVAAKQLFDARYNEKAKQDILYNMFVLFGLNPKLSNRLNEQEINSMIYEMKDIALKYSLGENYGDIYLDNNNLSGVIPEDTLSPGMPTENASVEEWLTYMKNNPEFFEDSFAIPNKPGLQNFENALQLYKDNIAAGRPQKKRKRGNKDGTD